MTSVPIVLDRPPYIAEKGVTYVQLPNLQTITDGLDINDSVHDVQVLQFPAFNMGSVAPVAGNGKTLLVSRTDSSEAQSLLSFYYRVNEAWVPASSLSYPALGAGYNQYGPMVESNFVVYQGIYPNAVATQRVVRVAYGSTSGPAATLITLADSVQERTSPLLKGSTVLFISGNNTYAVGGTVHSTFPVTTTEFKYRYSHWDTDAAGNLIVLDGGEMYIQAAGSTSWTTEGTNIYDGGICYNPYDGYWYVLNDSTDQVLRRKGISGSWTAYVALSTIGGNNDTIAASLMPHDGVVLLLHLTLSGEDSYHRHVRVLAGTNTPFPYVYLGAGTQPANLFRGLGTVGAVIRGGTPRIYVGPNNSFVPLP